MNYHSGVSDVLMKATVNTLSNQDCRRKLGRFFFIALENICAGGPLVVQVEGNSHSTQEFRTT